MERERFTENLLMYPGMALMCAAAIYFYLAGVVFLPTEVMNDAQAYPLYRMSLVRETLGLFVVRATLGLSGLGLSVIHAWKKWQITPTSTREP